MEENALVKDRSIMAVSTSPLLVRLPLLRVQLKYATVMENMKAYVTLAGTGKMLMLFAIT